MELLNRAGTLVGLGDSWNSMELIVKGDVFTISLNNKELFKVKDTTFTKAGKVGLWD